MHRIIAWSVVALVAYATPAYTQSAKLLQAYSDWTAYTSTGTAKRVCFVVSQPKSKAPKGVKRGPVYFYISHYPGDKVQNEISVKMGYPLKTTPVEVKIGTTAFKLFTKAEGAFVEKKEDENKLVEAMKGGSQMVIQGRSTRGTLTTDKYSLNGLSAALDRIANDCK